MPTQAENLAVWDEGHAWPQGGDEWDEFATEYGQSYQDWKRSLIRTFIEPHARPDSRVLEIGCGHGRWSEHLVGRVAHVYLCDLSPRCIDVCRAKFGPSAATYLVTGGDLGEIPDASVDFVWSFDVMVHMDADDIQRYLREIRRVATPHALAILHHADDPSQSTHFGWRAQDMSAAKMRRMVDEADLITLLQTDCWGPDRMYSVKRCQDLISVISPTAPEPLTAPRLDSA